MLMTMKAYIEGTRALAYWVGILIDVEDHHPDAAKREEAADLVALMTPVIKAFGTDVGFEIANIALQCFGGHGYIAEHGMEQLARDARITTLYEGTTGVQALDLVGRKLLQLRGAGLRVMLEMIESFCAAHAGDGAVAEFIEPLRSKAAEWQRLSATIAAASAGNAEEAGAAACDYLFYSGYVALAYWWARSVAAAAASRAPAAFRDAKLETARFYFARILPRTLAHKIAIESGAAPLMALAEERFDA
jgi:hypothetical protein